MKKLFKTSLFLALPIAVLISAILIHQNTLKQDNSDFGTEASGLITEIDLLDEITFEPEPEPESYDDLVAELEAIYADLQRNEAAGPSNFLQSGGSRSERDSRFIEVKNEDGAVVSMETGSNVTIPANCFMDENGHYISGTVTVEVKEIRDKASIMMANLPTIAGDEMLESAGVFYLNAEVNGQPVEIAPGKRILISNMNVRQGDGWRVFNADFDEQGEVDWLSDQSYNMEMVPFPTDLVHLNRWHGFISNKALEKLRSKENENTFISTLAFEARLKFATRAGTIWYKQNKTNVADELMDIYLNNLDKNLYEADKLVYTRLADLVLLGNHKRDLNRIDSTRKAFHLFYKQKKLRPEIVEDYGIDLSSSSAYADLLATGLSKEDAKNTLGIYKTRENITRARIQFAERTNSTRGNRVGEMRDENFEAIFGVKQLGWINIDRFYKDPRAEEIKLMVKLTNDPQDSKDMRVYVVFKDINSFIPAYLGTDGTYCIQGGARKLKLPKGVPVALVAMGTNSTDQFLAVKDIVLGDNEMEELTLQRAPIETMKEQLALLD
jgi:hypothetical protein